MDRLPRPARLFGRAIPRYDRRMRALYALLPLAAFFAQPAWAQSPERAGHYYLRGVMETGSELMLHADGRFQWYLVYGALDLFAEGKWTEKDGAVLLTAEATKDVPQPGFRTLTLSIRDKALVPPDGRGAYVRPADDED
ncbi:hypothetical protein [Sphingobium chlorophenolicum]|uniref:hypothetical protein n=1 Tax=Sphingobium chlorophenolicum TaxID=46429 RepID=UPI001F2C2EDB|nr:hypothetical protein [Sphingobium chlorophenolicum]